MNRVKYPRTQHLPWSPGVQSDDVIASELNIWGKEIVITEKRDGENTSLYSDGYIHARSISSSSHPWQAVIKQLWSSRYFQIPASYRIIGENLVATHSIAYRDVSALEVFAIYDGQDLISWDDTEEWCSLLQLPTVPVLWRGIAEKSHLQQFHTTINTTKQEGFVVRLTSEIPMSEFNHSVAKWVRSNHVQTDQHWTRHWRYNQFNVP